MKALALLVIYVAVLVLTFVSVQASTPCYPCDPNWPRPLYYPNFDDCNTVYECNQGNSTLTSCDPGTVFEFLLQACVVDNEEMLFTCQKLLHKKSTC